MKARFVYVVVNNLPQEFGEREVHEIFDNRKAAECELKCLRQLDDYANQYMRIERYALRSRSTMTPVKKRV